ncbi:MAG: hypothetical protein D6815_12800 [Candidatus Dadabacteria bacterium]|nr:MAG: hypothetical protein D6815_12800 [Candidatus Dadabacteria bacterium]
MAEWLYSQLRARRAAVVAVLAALTVVLGGLATQLRFDNTIESYFFEADLADYNRFLETFGTDEIVVLAFGADDVFSRESLSLVDFLSRGLERLPYVRRVLSLTTVRIVEGAAGSVSFAPLVEALPVSGEQCEWVKRRALADALLPRTLVAPDGRATAVVAEIEHIVGEFDYKVKLLRQVRALARRAEERSGKHIAIGGTSVLDDALFRYTERDQRLFVPIMLAVIVAVMVRLFGGLTATLIPLAVVALAMAWTYGFMVALGYAVNVITTIIAPLVMAVSIADSMHIVAAYQRKLAAGAGREQAALHTFCELLAPCFLTSATTVGGLLSLVAADLAPLREFGIVASFGVAAAFAVTVVLVPLLLPALPAERMQPRSRSAGAIERLLGWLAAWHRRRAEIVVGAAALLVVPALVSARHVTVGTNSLDFFHPDDPVRRDTEWIDASVAGTTSIEFLVDCGRAGCAYDPVLLARIDAFQSYLEAIDGITTAYSLVDFVKTLNRAYGEGRAEEYAIPDSAAAVAQELLVLEGSADLRALLSEDARVARISARVALDHSRALAHRMPEIEAHMREVFAGSGARIMPTGIVYLMHRMEGYLLSSQIKSFLLAFLVVGLGMFAALASVRLGLIALVPNLVPIAIVLGLMRPLGIALDVGTVMIASVALGLIVDDTIHLLYCLKREARAGGSAAEAMGRAVLDAGRPVVYTSVVLALGFSVLVAASFAPVTHFGVLAAVVVMVALACDLVLLPAVVGLVGLGRGAAATARRWPGRRPETKNR